ncbi:MAG: PAC2 family protein [Acidimicrobiaceae bacterium]|nr:PAC2 family protein [Acidimicrobiaceae bacterium]
MSDLVKIHRWPALDRPVLVMALEGWVDAGFAASSAARTLRTTLPHWLLATFDADQLIDHRARRPTLRISNGVNTELRWPEIRLDAAVVSPAGRSVLMLTGPEPDMRWHQWSQEVVRLVTRLGVELVVGLGAFPAPVPHTRPVRLVSTGNNTENAGKVGFMPVTIDVPAGAQGVLEFSFGQAGIPTIGLWARVPHYVAGMPYPAASAALLRELSNLIGVSVDTGPLEEAATSTGAQIDELISASDEHEAMVRQLESQHDNEETVTLEELPTGDEIAAELERFLKGQG